MQMNISGIKQMVTGPEVRIYLIDKGPETSRTVFVAPEVAAFIALRFLQDDPVHASNKA